jgi:hypothetical protein
MRDEKFIDRSFHTYLKSARGGRVLKTRGNNNTVEIPTMPRLGVLIVLIQVMRMFAQIYCQ